MRIILLLFICATRSAATCLSILNEKERTFARYNPGGLVKWNRRFLKFEVIEAFNQNYRSICSVDYIDDLTGKTVVVSGEILPPYLALNPDNTLTGYIGDIWTTLEKALKFRTIFRPSLNTNGVTLQRGYADEWLGAVTMSYRMTGHLVYSHQVGENSYGLYALSEGYGVSKWWYMSIFSPGLWAMSFIFVVGITGLILVMYRFKRAICRDYEECNNQLAIPSFNLLSVLGVMTGQGFQEIPTAWSLRFLMLSAVVMGMLVSCGFSSTLTSYLTIRGNTLHFNSLQDIVQKKTHSLCVRNGSNAYWEMHDMTVNDTNKWGYLINKNCPNMENAAEFATKLCQPGVVYVEAPDVFLSAYYPIRHKCRIAQIPGQYWSSRIAFAHARAAPHRLLINKYLLRLHSAGILQYLEHKWTSKEWPTSSERQLTFKSVEYGHIDLIALALVGMILASGFICVLENIWFRVESTRARINMTRLRVDTLNNLLEKTSNFPAVQVDPKTRRIWKISVRNYE